MRVSFLLSFLTIFAKNSVCVPVRAPKQLILLPAAGYQPIYGSSQIRGPLDFIGSWIQSSEWFPIEVNVPDTFSNVGSGIQSFGQNVGNGWQSLQQNVGNGWESFQQNFGPGFQSFQQNVGNGFNNFAQSLGNGVRNFTQQLPFNRPPVRYYVLVPVPKAPQPPKLTANDLNADDLLDFP